MNQNVVTQSSILPIDDDRLDVQHYLHSIKRYKWLVLLIAGVGIGLGAWAAASMKPVYRASVTLMLQSTAANVISIQNIYEEDPFRNRNYLRTQLGLLSSKDLYRRVIKELGLSEHPSLLGQDAEPFYSEVLNRALSWLDIQDEDADSKSSSSPENVLNAFAEGVSVEAPRSSQLVIVSFESGDPELAATAANGLAEAYIAADREERGTAATKASAWLSGQLKKLRSRLVASEKAFRKFIDKQPLSYLETLPEVLGDSSVQSLKQSKTDARRKISELSERYGPEHPNLVEARIQLKEAGEALRKEIRRVVASLVAGPSTESPNTRQRARAPSKGKAQSKEFFGSELRRLEQEVETNRELYRVFLARAKETNILGGSLFSNARIVDHARIPTRPFKPQKTLIVGASFGVSLILGLMLALTLDSLNTTLETSNDVESRLGISVFGMVPKWKGFQHSPIVENEQLSVAEAFRTIRTNFMLSDVDDPPKAVMIVSSVAGEGKSTTAVALAHSLGQLDERVLLLDADMRNPSIAQMCGLVDARPGLSEAIGGLAPPSACVRSGSFEGVDVMPAGSIPSNPLELLASERFARLLEALEKKYDRVIIDSAPAMAVSDALVIASCGVAIIFVVRAEATPYKLAQSAIKRLRTSHRPILGAVLNGVDVKRLSSYGKYSYYGDYYGEYRYADDETRRHRRNGKARAVGNRKPGRTGTGPAAGNRGGRRGSAA